VCSKDIFQVKNSFTWGEGHNFHIVEQNWMIRMLNGTFRDELQIIFKLHHQSSIDCDLIVFLYTKCLFIGLFTLVKDESNTLILTF
jgi:hypothetical protein